MAIVTTSQNLTAVSYVAGEIIEIRNGATLTINSTPATRPGTIQCITSGKLRIENTSTTTPIVVELFDNTRDLRFESNGVLEIRGAMMELGTGTGAAQTFDFATLYGGALTDITYVEVETAVGSGDYMPWHIAEIASRFYAVGRSNNLTNPDGGTVTTDYDGNQPIFFFNSDTRVLSSGNGTNGLSVPSGCKIRIPNILITNQDWQPDVALAHRIESRGTPTGGTFTITLINRRTGTTIGTTGTIAHNASAATIDTAIEAVLGVNTITSSNGPLPTVVSLTLAGAYASTPIAMVVNSSVTGGTNSIIYSLENDAGNMSLLDINPAGTFDAEMCMLSRKIRHVHIGFGSFRAFRVGVGSDVFQFEGSNGGVDLDHVSHVGSPYVLQVGGIRLNGIFGVSSLRKVVCTTATATNCSLYTTIPLLTKAEDLRQLNYGVRTNVFVRSMIFQFLPVDVVRPRCVGGAIQFNGMSGRNLIDPSTADHPGTVQLTATAVPGIDVVASTGVVISNYQKAGTCAPRLTLLNVAVSASDVELFGGSYDCSNNSPGIVTHAGSGGLINNFTCTNQRGAGASVDLLGSQAASALRIRKYFSTMFSGATLFRASKTGQYDLAACAIDGFVETHSGIDNFVGGNFMVHGLSPTTGHVTFGAFAQGDSLSLTGSAITSKTGQILLPADGDIAVATIPFSMHGITAFQNVASTFVAESEGGFSDRWRIINDGGVTGGTFTLTFYDATNVLIGTTGAIAWNATTAAVDTAIEAVLGAGTVTVTGALATGYIITRAGGTIIRATVDGALLTGGTKAGTANALGYHNIAIASGTALTAGTTLGGMTLEFAVRNPGAAWGAYQALTSANLSGAIAALSGYSANDGLEMRVKITANGADDYRTISQISMPTDINPAAWTLDDASIIFQGASATDEVKILRASDNVELYSFTGGGVKTFTVGANFGVEVYVRRQNASAVELMKTLPNTFRIKFGSNGTIPLFYGAEVQLAQSTEVAAIKTAVDAYLDATISSRLAAANYTQPLTTAKFLALK
jgi:hypothetical protein